jgi:hypothetical protein
LFKGVALTQHRNVPKIRFESYPDIASRFAVPDQLEFGFDNGRNKDAHGVTVGYFPCGESVWSIVVVWRVDFASDNVVQMSSELDLAFEAPLFVGSPREGIDCTYDGIQSGLVDILTIFLAK